MLYLRARSRVGSFLVCPLTAAATSSAGSAAVNVPIAHVRVQTGTRRGAPFVEAAVLVVAIVVRVVHAKAAQSELALLAGGRSEDGLRAHGCCCGVPGWHCCLGAVVVFAISR